VHGEFQTAALHPLKIAKFADASRVEFGPLGAGPCVKPRLRHLALICRTGRRAVPHFALSRIKVSTLVHSSDLE